MELIVAVVALLVGAYVRDRMDIYTKENQA